MTGPLDATLTVAPTADGFALTLTVENAGEESVDLSFRDGQRAEFVAGSGGEEVWRWSDGRMFTAVLGGETVAPGGFVEYAAEWADPPAGEYEVRGWLVAADADAEASMTVVVPDDG